MQNDKNDMNVKSDKNVDITFSIAFNVQHIKKRPQTLKTTKTI